METASEKGRDARRKPFYGRSVARIFLSYLAILLIPLALLAILIGLKGNDILYAVNKGMYTGILRRARDGIDGMWAGAESLSISLAADTLVQRMANDGLSYRDYKTGGTGQLMELHRDLSRFQASRDYIDEIVLYGQDDDFVISTQGVDGLDWFFNQAYTFSGLMAAQWDALLNDPETGRLLGPVTGKFYGGPIEEILFFKNFSFNRDRTVRICLFLNVKRITDALESVRTNHNITAALVGGDGRIIASPADRDLVNAVLGSRRYDPADPQSFSGIYTDPKKNSFYCMMLPAGDGPFPVLSIVPARLLRNAGAASAWFLLFFAMVFLVGLAACWMLARMNVRPLMGIVKAVRGMLASSQDDPLAGDVYRYILSAIRIESQSRETLALQVGQFRQMAQYACLVDIFGGQWGSEGRADRILALLPELAGKACYQVAVLSPVAKCRTSIIASGIVTEMALSEGVKAYVSFYDNLAVVLFLLPTAEERTRHVPEAVTRIVYDGEDAALTVGVGESRGDWRDAMRSLQEARTAADYRMSNRERIVFHKEIRGTGGQGYYYPLDMEAGMIHCLKAGDFDGARSRLRQVVETNLRDADLSSAMRKCLFYDITATVYRILAELGDRGEMAREFGMTAESVTAIEDLLSCVEGAFQEICRRRNEAKESHNEPLRGEIVSYIDASFTDPNLSLTALADRFGMSPSYLSRFIKDQLGYGFNEYVTAKRVEKAKALLESGLSVNEVYGKVGYNSALSLRRAFKHLQGVTPGTVKNESPRKK